MSVTPRRGGSPTLRALGCGLAALCLTLPLSAREEAGVREYSEQRKYHVRFRKYRSLVAEDMERAKALHEPPR